MLAHHRKVSFPRSNTIIISFSNRNDWPEDWESSLVKENAVQLGGRCWLIDYSQTCRARHFECMHVDRTTFVEVHVDGFIGDKTQPICRRCSDTGRDCVSLSPHTLSTKRRLIDQQVPAFNVRFRQRRNFSVGRDKFITSAGQEWVETCKPCR